jgi:membrane-associated phospholipid phosphatase
VAVRPVDKLLAGYLTIVTLLVLVRGGPTDPGDGSLLVLHALIGLLLFLFTRLDEAHTVGQFLWDLYPLLLIPFLYAEIGVLAEQLGRPAILAHDAIVQRWEEALFGSQVSYVWIREAPSVFWSTVLHLAYFSYYPIVFLGPFLLLARRERQRARKVMYTIVLAYLICYVVFILYPVAGPNWVWEHPTGPVRQVWSARLVYAILEGGSSIGAAFPSSHVAATIAATLALWHQWRSLALVFLVPAMLLVVATVYCQMHYVIDAVTGLMVGIPVGWLAPRVEA